MIEVGSMLRAEWEQKKKILKVQKSEKATS